MFSAEAHLSYLRCSFDSDYCVLVRNLVGSSDLRLCPSMLDLNYKESKFFFFLLLIFWLKGNKGLFGSMLVFSLLTVSKNQKNKKMDKISPQSKL